MPQSTTHCYQKTFKRDTTYGITNLQQLLKECVIMELSILYLLKILANKIGHRLLQQSARLLQFTTNYVHDRNHVSTYIIIRFWY